MLHICGDDVRGLMVYLGHIILPGLGSLDTRGTTPDTSQWLKVWALEQLAGVQP